MIKSIVEVAGKSFLTLLAVFIPAMVCFFYAAQNEILESVALCLLYFFPMTWLLLSSTTLLFFKKDSIQILLKNKYLNLAIVVSILYMMSICLLTYLKMIDHINDAFLTGYIIAVFLIALSIMLKKLVINKRRILVQ